MSDRFIIEKSSDNNTVVFIPYDGKDGHGKQGQVKKGGFWSRSVTVANKEMNAGSLIDFLNTKIPVGDKPLKKGWFFGWGGSSDKAITDAFNKVYNIQTPEAVKNPEAVKEPNVNQRNSKLMEMKPLNPLKNELISYTSWNDILNYSQNPVHLAGDHLTREEGLNGIRMVQYTKQVDSRDDPAISTDNRVLVISIKLKEDENAQEILDKLLKDAISALDEGTGYPDKYMCVIQQSDGEMMSQKAVQALVSDWQDGLSLDLTYLISDVFKKFS